MNTGTHDYDVIIVGYGPVGVTAANLLGGMGVRVAVVERDASIYARARAISTDEEVIRIWQGSDWRSGSRRTCSPAGQSTSSMRAAARS
jgi:2-polyprenyl-6-methoxyphenol hydroxylase-like FAD-dependent oxidoreductase